MKHPKVGSVSKTHSGASSALLVNARDLSEPPNGTTSGCPPPSQDDNYRTLLHTQQRNRSKPGESGRFWKGVAQITRSRDRGFHASHCYATLFSIGSICLRVCRRSTPPVGFPLLAPRHRPNRAPEGGPPPSKRPSIATPEERVAIPATSESALRRLDHPDRGIWRAFFALIRERYETCIHRHEIVETRMLQGQNEFSCRARDAVASSGARRREADIQPRFAYRPASGRCEAPLETAANHVSGAKRRHQPQRWPPRWPFNVSRDRRTGGNQTSGNLSLAARPGVGHIRPNGAVAEWLKAAVC